VNATIRLACRSTACSNHPADSQVARSSRATSQSRQRLSSKRALVCAVRTGFRGSFRFRRTRAETRREISSWMM
jgi:hypothetical protein